MSSKSPLSVSYIFTRAVQLVFCVAVFGIACYLRFVTYAGWTTSGYDLPYISTLPYTYGWKRDAMPKGGGGKSSSSSSSYSGSGSSSSYSDDDDYYSSSSDSYINPWVPLGLLISAGILGSLVVIASLATQCCGSRRTAQAMLFFVGFDTVMVILFAAASAMTGRYITQYDTWTSIYYTSIIFKVAFGLAILLVFLFLSTAIRSIFLSKRGKKTAAAYSGPPAYIASVPPQQQHKHEAHISGQYHPQSNDQFAHHHPQPHDQYEHQPPFHPTMPSASTPVQNQTLYNPPAEQQPPQHYEQQPPQHYEQQPPQHYEQQPPQPQRHY